MAVVNLSINGRVHEIACDDQQVGRIHVLGQMIDGISQDLLKNIGNVPDTRLMLMVALTLADELADLRESLDQAGGEMSAFAEADIALSLGVDALADRIEAIAERLERS